VFSEALNGATEKAAESALATATMQTVSTTATTSIGTMAAAAEAAAFALNQIAAAGASDSSGELLDLFVSAAGSGSGTSDANSQTGQQIRDRRAGGGGVKAWNAYSVNEYGAPELLEMRGKQYLMMGSESGNVRPLGTGGADSAGGGQSRPIIIQVTTPPNASRKTGMQFGAGIRDQLARSTRVS
jgi:hypothetical protein